MKVALPYQDTKPQGAADFYLGINATFRFVKTRLRLVGLKSYWEDMGREYFQPVTKIWREGGLPAVAGYWRSFLRPNRVPRLRSMRSRGGWLFPSNDVPPLLICARADGKSCPSFASIAIMSVKPWAAGRVLPPGCREATAPAARLSCPPKTQRHSAWKKLRCANDRMLRLLRPLRVDLRLAGAGRRREAGYGLLDRRD